MYYKVGDVFRLVQYSVFRQRTKLLLQQYHYIVV